LLISLSDWYRRDTLKEYVAALEQRLNEAEFTAFEQEARAAELEVELFRSMDEDHEKALSEVRGPVPAPHSCCGCLNKTLCLQAKSLSTGSLPATPQAESAPARSKAPTGDVAVVMQFRSDSSPRLPLRKASFATPRIPREGYAGLLMLVSVGLLFAVSPVR
jgi:hypothetical protein